MIFKEKALLIGLILVLSVGCQNKSKMTDILLSPQDSGGKREEKVTQQEWLVGVDKKNHTIVVYNKIGQLQNKIMFAGEELIKANRIQIKQAESGYFLVLFSTKSESSISNVNLLKFGLTEKFYKPINLADRAVTDTHLLNSENVVLDQDGNWNLITFADFMLGFINEPANKAALLLYPSFATTKTMSKFVIEPGSHCGLPVGLASGYAYMDKMGEAEFSLVSLSDQFSGFKIQEKGISCVNSQRISVKVGENFQRPYHAFVKGTHEFINADDSVFWSVQMDDGNILLEPHLFYTRPQKDVTSLSAADYSGSSFYFSTKTSIYNYNLISQRAQLVVTIPNAELSNLQVVH